MVKFKTTPLNDVKLQALYGNDELVKKALQTNITPYYLKEFKGTIEKNPKRPYNIEADVIGPRGLGKSYFGLKTIQNQCVASGLSLSELAKNIEQFVFFTDDQILEHIVGNRKMKDVTLMKDEESEEIGADSLTAQRRVRRFADSIRKRRVNILWLAPRKYIFTSDYTCERLDFVDLNPVSRSLLRSGDWKQIPMGVVYMSIPDKKVIEAYEKMKEDYLDVVGTGEMRSKDWRVLVATAFTFYKLWDKMKVVEGEKAYRLTKGKFTQMIKYFEADYSYNEFDEIWDTTQLYFDGVFIITPQMADKERLERWEELATAQA